MTGASDVAPDYTAYPRLSVEQSRAAAHALIAMCGDGAAASDVELLRVERFYRREARLLDEERYHEWYGLLADDLFYWMPLRPNLKRRDGRPALDPEAMALFDECKADIAVRIARFSSGQVWTEDPPTRHVYVVSGVEAFHTDIAGEFEVHSSFVQYRNRSEHDEALLCGRRRDLLRCCENGFLIVRRLILSPQSVLLSKNLSVFF
ncbi:MAG: 3-phenylpropionate/cinnamic acid dioxygenase subunit beta [Terricaulis sp.]